MLLCLFLSGGNIGIQITFTNKTNIKGSIVADIIIVWFDRL